MPNSQHLNRALVNDDLNILKNINWDFSHEIVVSPTEVSPFNCRKYHWFPGTYIPQIPFSLIEILSKPGAVIYDPFSGIGTTYFQALTLNRKPLATEICIVAVNYCKNMFVLFNPEYEIEKTKEKINDLYAGYDSSVKYSNLIIGCISLDKLEPWYEKEAFNKLCYLIFRKQEADDQDISAAMDIIISSILKTVSRQDRGWGCIADNMLPNATQVRAPDVFGVFRRSLNVLYNDLSLHKSKAISMYKDTYREISGMETIFHCDVRVADIIPEATVDMVITSPPYPNMIDYVTSQRLSYYYLGANLNDDSALEIGARNRRRRQDALRMYETDMIHFNRIISNKIKQDGYACYVMPSFNTDNGNNAERKKITDILLSTMEEYNFTLVSEFDRAVSNKRRDHNSKWTSLEQEKILIYRKG